MEELDNSKRVLKESLKRLQEIVSAKIEKLETENSLLRTQIIQLKQEVLKLKTDSDIVVVRSKDKAEQKSKQKTLGGDSDLLSNEATNEIDLTLSELKKLVGQN